MTSPDIAGFVDAITSRTLRVVDLTTPLSASTPALRLPPPFANLIDFSLEEVSAYNEPGPFWRHNNIHTGEHIGTHLDAPVHWITGRDGDDVSQIPVQRLIGSAAVLDLTAQVDDNPDYLLTIADVQTWENEHRPLGAGDWLLLRTGWESKGHSQEAFLNADETGSHTPGVDAECAKWLAAERDITGIGVETVGVDAGLAGGFDPAFPVHHHFLGHDKYGITSLRNLNELPTTGAMLIVTPLPIVGGTGSPSRVLAVVDGTPE
ncbi:cyclase family protein [Gordonia sp. ABSL49_1]|uniref:cyclase family protein n=1 Tax=unclassified Gordonia (in: high G+C Gram-positive bacteria) TaxID=2657482 RepID=UPI001F0D90FF|nr:cyclase family protein [Gordonia sp. ABSL49_1]MCH5641823.1 cyclase family protein [Gordonia sp. ABSL49_1]